MLASEIAASVEDFWSQFFLAGHELIGCQAHQPCQKPTDMGIANQRGLSWSTCGQDKKRAMLAMDEKETPVAVPEPEPAVPVMQEEEPSNLVAELLMLHGCSFQLHSRAARSSQEEQEFPEERKEEAKELEELRAKAVCSFPCVTQ